MKVSKYLLLLVGPLPLNQDKVCNSAHIRGLLYDPTSPVEIPIFLHTFFFLFLSLSLSLFEPFLLEFPIPFVGEKGCFLELHNTINYNHKTDKYKWDNTSKV